MSYEVKMHTKTETKNEKLAIRLGEILTRLNSGQVLNVQQLAQDFNTHRRTILRDFDERLVYLHIHKEGQNYRFSETQLGKLSFSDIQQFAHISGFSSLYPNLDKTIIRELLDTRAKSIYAAKGYFFEDTSKFTQLLSTAKKAVHDHQQIAFIYKDRVRVVQPYRIVHHRGCWYLAAARKNKLIAYRFSKITPICYTRSLDRFKPKAEILKQLEDEESIWFGQEKIEFILTVRSEVASHFKQRQLLPNQSIIKELSDGSLLLSSKVPHPRQLMSLIRYWIPNIKIVSPEKYQSELANELQQYIKEIRGEI